jgi:hypothetical protein
MADLEEQRPFDNFRLAITDPPYFFGNGDLLTAVKRSPFEVRILLGGRRIGKTSFLRAVEWSLLKPNNDRLENPAQISGDGRSSGSWVKKNLPTFSKMISRQSKSKQSRSFQNLSSSEGIQAFPVFISLQVEQPSDLDSFRYLLIARLREAMNRWRSAPSGVLREQYRHFLSQVEGGELTMSFLSAINLKLNVKNSSYEKRLSHDDFRKALLASLAELQGWEIDGICFLLDGSEFVVGQAWANDAWSYLRGLKDTDTALKPFIGFLFSGYRNLRDYQQAVGSPLLNIAEVNWLTTLTKSELQSLISHRNQDKNVKLTDQDQEIIVEWGGGHPYLSQQLINYLLDTSAKSASLNMDSLKYDMLKQHDRDFSAWWDDPQRPYSLGESERKLYKAIMQCRQGTVESLIGQLHLSHGAVTEALEVLVGTGMIKQTNEESWEIGSRLFEEWVLQQ